MLLNRTEEIEISNINDLYEIEERKKEYFKTQETDIYEKDVLFFRGQSDYSWKLEVSIKRYNNLVEWKELEEYDPNVDNLFSYIAKCQHYGKKTRFLDFTTDIDIALFFACDENEDIDGSLYMCPYVPRKASWNDTIIVSELSLLKDEISVDNFASQLLAKYADLRNKYSNTVEISTRIVSWLDHGFMVLPDTNEYEIMKKDNPRIYNQKGAFFICGNQTKKPLDDPCRRISTHAGYNIIIPKISDIPDTIQENRHITKVKIPSTMKKDILNFLNEKGINRDYLLVK